MNTERLLQHYEQIADAPDAIVRLRRFILDLAVRGKLLPQDPSDEPASELLKRITKEQIEIRPSGGLKKNLVPDNFSAHEYPFFLPSSWVWSRLGDIVTKLTDGTHHSPDNGPIGDFKYITAKNIKESGVSLDQVTYVSADVHAEIFSRCNPEKGDILYIKDGATTGVVTVNDLDEPFSMLSSVALLKLPAGVFNRLLVVFLRSPFFYEQMRGFMKGAAITRVTLKRMAPALVPLPPFAEQHRIVAKVDELMALCDELEAARTERETKRDRLAAASLARLNTPDPETFRDDARFALDAMPALTARPDQIKQLRQTILNLAVRGKLVPQDPTDEPAEELLKRIQRARVVEGKASRQVAIEDTNALSGPRPRGWVTTAVQHVSEVGTGSTPTSTDSSYYANGSIPWLTSSSSGLDKIASAENFVTEKAVSDFRLKVYPPGSLLVALYGQGKTRGQVAKLAINAAVNQACAVITWIEGFEDLCHFLFIVFKQQYHEMRLKAEGGAQPNLNLRKIKELRFDLPPLAEQHRIVAKVDELMALCDELETSLTSADETRKKLLDALLAEALAPVDADALQEAAE
jgi:type I restriction enzyme S subunit